MTRKDSSKKWPYHRLFIIEPFDVEIDYNDSSFIPQVGTIISLGLPVIVDNKWQQYDNGDFYYDGDCFNVKVIRIDSTFEMDVGKWSYVDIICVVTEPLTSIQLGITKDDDDHNDTFDITMEQLGELLHHFVRDNTEILPEFIQEMTKQLEASLVNSEK
jgi:hypothetical protein